MTSLQAASEAAPRSASFAVEFAEFSGWPAEWAKMIEGWRSVPLVIAGSTAGVALLDGSEIHFVLRSEWRGRAITRARARRFLAPLIARYGYLTTRAISPQPEQRDFLRRMGFRHTWTQPDGTEHYMLTCLPFDRKGQTTCP